MAESKFLKAKCRKTGLFFGLDVKKYGSVWKVVNMVRLSDEEAKLTASEVRQDAFETNSNLLACSKCGNRRIGGCSCSKKLFQCSPRMKYKFDCVYCSEFEVDYSRPTARDISKHSGGTVTLSQGKEVKIITFSNVKWNKFDNIKHHESGAKFGEPRIHVIANEENIEFHGYNISQMDEGVYYTINSSDDFEIECDVDTSTIQPHPGGHLYISFGSITAMISEKGGTFCLDGKSIAKVGSRFHMVLSLIDNVFSITIDNEKKGELHKYDNSKVKITFGFTHESHYCSILSHAYIRGIKMRHGVSNNESQ